MTMMGDNNDQDQSESVHEQSQKDYPPTASNVGQTPLQPDKPVIQNQETIQTDGFDGSKSNKKLFIFLSVLLMLIIIATGIFALNSIFNEQSKGDDHSITDTPTTNELEVESEQPLLADSCDDFPDMLEICSQYICKFTHPITGEQMTREIQGISSDSCIYIEQMPNDGRMDCEYTEEMRIAVAQYYRDIFEAESFGFESTFELQPNGSEVDSTNTIDGEIVSNPLQEALDLGQCIVSGY